MIGPITNKVLYSPGDRRQNFYEIQDEKIKRQALSIGCMVRANQLTGNYHLRDSVPTLSNWVQKMYGYPLGDREVFADELSAGLGTAFLVTKRTILTAAHCVCLENTATLDPRIKSTLILFNFYKNHKEEIKREFEASDVYRIESVVDYKYESSSEGWSDWALLKLDREVVGREPLKIDFSNLSDAQELYTLGHPGGVYLKHTWGATVMDNKDPNHFSCDLDTFAGNSGSPVFRKKTYEIVGIVCCGNTDYIIDHNYGSLGVTRCKPNTMSSADTAIYGFEKCQRINRIDFVKDYIDFRLGSLACPNERLIRGLNIQARCTNSACTVMSQLFLIRPGIGTFDIRKLAAYSTCTTCKADDIEFVSVGLHQCRYRIKGEVIRPHIKKIQKTGETAHDKLTTIDLVPSISWNDLEIKSHI